jgi:hypothetical protein
MQYEQLGQDYMDDYLAEALYAREVEFFQYDFDRRNFEHLLRALPQGQYREMVEGRLRDTLVNMDSVSRVHEALRAQIRSPEAHAAALARVRARRDAGE